MLSIVLLLSSFVSDVPEDLEFDLAVTDFVVRTIPPDRFDRAVASHTLHILNMLNEDCYDCRQNAFELILKMEYGKIINLISYAKMHKSAEVRHAGYLLEERMKDTYPKNVGTLLLDQ